MNGWFMGVGSKADVFIEGEEGLYTAHRLGGSIIWLLSAYRHRAKRRLKIVQETKTCIRALEDNMPTHNIFIRRPTMEEAALYKLTYQH